MALFFDQKWFDRRLAELGETHEGLAEALHLPLADLAAIWKDQRLIMPDELSVLADFLKSSPEEVSGHAGQKSLDSGENARQGTQSSQILLELSAKVDSVIERLERMETELSELKQTLKTMENQQGALD